MIVMPADTCNRLVYLWQGRYRRLGWLLNAYTPHQLPWHEMPYAIDNGAFSAFTNGKPWDEGRYLHGLTKYRNSGSPILPRFMVVPDVVCDRDATLDLWQEWSARLRIFWPSVPLAFVAQDGMTPRDVPLDAEVVFIGGSDEFKAEALFPWCRAFPRVHVGRVNSYEHLVRCEAAGAESCDGTGWFHGRQEQLKGLEAWLAETSGERPRAAQTCMSFDDYDAATARGSRSASTGERAPSGAGNN